MHEWWIMSRIHHHPSMWKTWMKRSPMFLKRAVLGLHQWPPCAANSMQGMADGHRSGAKGRRGRILHMHGCRLSCCQTLEINEIFHWGWWWWQPMDDFIMSRNLLVLLSNNGLIDQWDISLTLVVMTTNGRFYYVVLLSNNDPIFIFYITMDQIYVI